MPLVAIIEDDKGLSEIYQVSLETAGLKTVVALDGKQGFDTVEKHRPDLVLLDIMLPQMSGDEVLARIRKTDWGKNLPVIILTNISQYEAPDAFNHLEFQGFLIKANNSPSQIIKRVYEELEKDNTKKIAS